MHILVIGAAGMVGRKFVAAVLANGALGGKPVERMTLQDVVEPHHLPAHPGIAIATRHGDLSHHGEAERLIADRPDVIVHLAAIVSGEAEADFDKGYRINLDGTRALLEAIRHVGDGYRPRLVFTSSIAVFGAPFPDGPIPDDFHLTPLTSYGTQKAISELLISDYTRRGILDGLSIRLPTICVRPGAPNKAASGFFSGIIREPLAGLEALLPVSDDVRHYFASPRAAVGFLTHAASMDLAAVGPNRALTMPGVTATVAEELAALRHFGGEKALALVRRQPDETIARIVAGWPRSFDAVRARALGFSADPDFDAIVRAHVEDERGEQVLG